ncbi:FecR domain-containing protein [Eleftheria terrae]|uniref:FecR domain-containing protein n=1 Tax=Eleftheria terrae TaxID=1597781 RepID=UPI00263AFD75|nr:FecR domain-containing protein [Eleftheria terrae]WKB53073.1 FecR domain-containing protein [Eleftheria terrae]
MVRHVVTVITAWAGGSGVLGRFGRIAVLALAGPAGAALACEPPGGRLTSVEGVVEIRPAQTDRWRPATLNERLCPGDTVAVRARSRAAIVLANDVLLRLDQHSVLTLTAVAADQPSELGLLRGALHVLTRFAKRFGVATPYLNAMVEGTEFTVAVDNGTARVSVAEGRVQAHNAAGRQTLLPGQAAESSGAAAPVALQVQPLDAVRWAMYYPQVTRPSEAALAALPPAAGAAARHAAAGRYHDALAAWPAALVEPLAVERAGWWLGVGRIDEAEALLARGRAAGGGDMAAGLALQSVIHVVRNRPAEGEAAAREAVALDPRAAAPQLALSYALQARRDPAAALAAARQATALEPGHPLAWARQAELELSAGELRAGEQSAARARALAPATPRVTALIGFAQLLRGEDAAARQTLAQAEAEAPGDPLAHVGQGLALLRAGALAEGRRRFEMAVMLAPGDAELRALLGRAYLAERRGRLAGEEFTLARQMDPRDPTPWFYEGMRKQQDNRPVEAAADFERALALNDERAVLRPRTLLDIDRAARTAALASVWHDLGFDAALLSAARGALLDDPQSDTAHRLLAEAYARDPRYETARVSELLQAQLRQSPRAEPVPPQELQPGLPVLYGPRALALQDTGAWFDEQPGGLRLGLMAGNRDQFGRALLAWRNTAIGQFSLGHFHYQTQGFRSRADVRLDFNSLLWQHELTPQLRVQAEWRRTTGDVGDTTHPLLPAIFEHRRDLTTQAVRLGLRYAPDVHSEWLASFIRGRRTGALQDVYNTPPFTFDDELRRDSRLAELLHSGHHGALQWTLGGSRYRDDRTITSRIVLRPPLCPAPLCSTPARRTEEPPVRHDLLFAYGSWSLASPTTLLWGLSHDRYEDGDIRQHRTHPKLGVVLQGPAGLRVRAALFGSVKGARAKEQTLEPTQFAGFNQLFDDPDGTRSRRVGLGLDQPLGTASRWGAEAVHGQLSVPVQPASNGRCGPAGCNQRWSSDLYRLHFETRWGARWAASVALERNAQSLSTRAAVLDRPLAARTWQLPMRLAYFLPGGLTAFGEVRGVQQRIEAHPSASSSIETPSERFWLVDLGLRWRLPSRSATATLEVANLFNRQFKFQGMDVITLGEPRAQVPPFQPGRTIAGRLEVRF